MPLILPSNTISGGYEIANSLRFNDDSSDYLVRTPSGAGNLRTMTFSFWIKRCNFTTDAQRVFSIFNNSGADQFWLRMSDGGNDYLDFFSQTSSSQTLRLVTNARLRDPSAWYHIVVAVDTTQATDTNRIKIYINGTQQTSFSTTSYPSQNTDLEWNKAIANIIGAQQSGGTAEFIDMYLAEVCFIDGSQLDPTSFGEFDSDTNIWKPIDVSGLTFGTNGFYLDFENSGSLGADVSGNGNNFTVNNLTSIDQTTDTCTNNFATMNALDNYHADGTFSNGNLEVKSRNTGYTYNTSTFGVNTGKWYWEVKWSAQPTGSSNQVLIGIAKRPTTSSTIWLGSQLYTYGYQGSDGHVKNNNGNATGSSATTYSVGDIISVALDLDNNKLHFAKNGSWTNSSDPAGNSGGVTITAPDSTSGDSGFYFAAFGDGNDSLQETGQFNFGSPIHSISSGNSDANGYGNFEYSVPSGYYALNSKNLAEYG